MEKLKKILLFVFVLPITLLLDFVMFSFTKNCASCGSFGTWLSHEGALSFPLIVLLGDYFNRILSQLNITHKR